ncbi:Phosphoesterase RecJ domain-containing protein [Candidatus Methylacidithermus pantelleriae]|uniref:Phosphoesterase RecJ domain-containing protein n=2 Tax=Candidatus Methylacidithermus pantelleriae TaxID=2744239 RepID=A0A8J2BRT4_9BACT|nr:Phosphoesterase RecJ domain-containing protein [Candidatus Methylacidithermus pantelleriae]
MNESWDEIGQLFKNARSIVILSHVRPDGDAYGSSLGLAWTLRALGKEVLVCNEDGMARSYRFLPGSEEVVSTPKTAPQGCDIVIAVDTSTQERLGPTFALWNRKVDINLDHHASNTCYGTWNLIDPLAPASALVCYKLLQALGWTCPKEAASCFYVGLLTDTNAFRFCPLSPDVFRMAAELVEQGADPLSLSEGAYRNYSIGQFHLLREILAQTVFAWENRVAYYRLTPALLKQTGAENTEVENFLTYLQKVSTVQVAFMLEELEPNLTRVSLRSRAPIDVCQIAQRFGGGGHPRASGIRARIPMAEMEKLLLEEIRQVLQ